MTGQWQEVNCQYFLPVYLYRFEMISWFYRGGNSTPHTHTHLLNAQHCVCVCVCEVDVCVNIDPSSPL